MAARRLVILVIVMLGISTLAAALVPAPAPEDETTTTTTTQRTDEEPRGELIRRRVDARDRPQVVRMHVGDQLQLAVTARRADQVEIRGLGALAEVDPDAPARFDLLPSERGTYPIRLLEARRTVGRIEVRPRVSESGRRGRKSAGTSR